MTDRPMKNVINLYNDQDLYTKFYVRLRSIFINVDAYSDYLPDNGTVVDIGCGYGLLLNFLATSRPNCSFIGADLDKRRIDVASKTIKKRDNVAFLLGDARNLDFPDCRAAIMVDFLHHIDLKDQITVLKRVYSFLNEGGVLIIAEIDPTSEPLKTSFIVDYILYRANKSRFRTPFEWNKVLKRIGFRVETIRKHIPLFARVMYVCYK